jgi:hypothetical protein
MTETTKTNNESNLDSLWYFPNNRWMYRSTKTKITAPITIPISNTESRLKKRIILNPGKNELTQEEYNHVLEHSELATLKPYFDEGSFVWDKNKKTNSFTDTLKPVVNNDLDLILSEVSKAASIEELEEILKKSKDPSVMMAAKERLAEINKASTNK